ncbi:iron-sulfur cluster assembly accessory protein [Methanococcoides methylutens]|uniref:Putative iron binding protein from the HesB_IscA_SufA family n=1 Tax=Methanococcoides methylutens MM1 TaxID=1434104 RepID=A0A0E3WYN4_METMT|nr:iron-sulfur cluster assembly accessory protein [Methanococcoides methylutens]AKB84094.1 putative iron binding protein from the HesB_IscA_SufA family [Methanococcoides methylutens MM1]
MIEITDVAATELKALLEAEDKQDHALRIFVAGMGCSGIQYGMALDNEIKEEDVTVDSKDVKIVMGPDISEQLEKATIDYIETDGGKGFIIDNPMAASGCSSCGGSCH